jgi:hypothetical protein
MTSFETLIKTIENSNLNAKGSLREIIRLLCDRLESDLNLLNNIELSKSTLFQSLSESLAISNGWLFRILKNKAIISTWEGEWINCINSLEMFYRNQYIPLYNKTIWMRDLLAAQNISKSKELTIVNSTIEIHQLYFEVYSIILTSLNEIPQD